MFRTTLFKMNFYTKKYFPINQPYLFLKDEIGDKHFSFWHYKTAIDSTSSGQNGRYFTGDIFRCIFENEKFCISITISLKFVPKGLTDNNPALV